MSHDWMSAPCARTDPDAGLEVGASVLYHPRDDPHGPPRRGKIAVFDGEYVAIADPRQDTIVSTPAVLATRDHAEAQRARQRRVDLLAREYLGDGIAHLDRDVERFCAIAKRGHDLCQHSYAGTFEACAAELGSAFLDGLFPEAIFDLDTGNRIDLHVGCPEITAAEDQGLLVNPLSGRDVADAQRADREHTVRLREAIARDSDASGYAPTRGARIDGRLRERGDGQFMIDRYLLHTSSIVLERASARRNTARLARLRQAFARHLTRSKR